MNGIAGSGGGREGDWVGCVSGMGGRGGGSAGIVGMEGVVWFG